MSDPDKTLKNLRRLARSASPDAEPTAVPSGFSTRVVAHAWSSEPGLGAWLHRLAWRALAGAALVAVLLAAVNVAPLLREADEEAASLVDFSDDFDGGDLS